MKFNFLALFFLSSFSANGSELFSTNNLQAKGVLLKFHQWPNDQEEELIVSYLKSKGLVKKRKN